MKTNENKKGISLIVLVITIIVIIILAAAVILTLTNNNLIEEASNARYSSDRANVEAVLNVTLAKITAENQQMPVHTETNLNDGVDYTVAGKSGTINWGTGANNLGIDKPKYSGDWKVDSDAHVTLTIGDKVYGNENGGSVTPPTENAKPGEVVGSDTPYVDNGKTAVIPKGFKVSDKDGEKNIDTGLVVIAPDESEFIWVPVPEAMLNSLVDTTNMRSNLTEWTKDGSLEGTAIAYSASGYREPDVGTNRDNIATYLDQMNTILGTSFVPNGTGNGSFKEYMQKEYNDIYASIKKNGGFYIGRYETGDLAKDKIVSKKDNSDIGAQTWYTMYAKQSKYASTLTGVNIKSNMIYGYQWDATMKWFTTSTNNVVKNYPVNAAYNSDLTKSYSNFSGSIKPTGSVKSINNIYDMAGNIFDWTAEAHLPDYRSLRGSRYDYGEIDHYAAYRLSTGSVYFFSHCGSRLALYL